MTKLYVKQKALSWRDKFRVKDEYGNDKYVVEGKILSVGKKLSVYDANGMQVMYVGQKVLSLLGRFDIEIGGCAYAVVRKLSVLRPVFRIEGAPWSVKGDFLEHNYRVFDGQNTIMNVSKRWFTWGDSYELDILDGNNELLCLAIVLAVDCLRDDA
jgi:uncharacterized protein YxjI